MFDDLKVLELASVLAGPSVGQFFAELGAEVVKVENILTGGDVTRTWKVAEEGTDDRSAYFCAVNWGKKSIAIDLSCEEGKSVVHKLATRADIVIASYKAGDAEKLGVDYKTLSVVHPKIIYAQITGFGSHNPRVGYDAVIQAESGFMFMNGEPGGNSIKMPVALMDVLAAHHLKEGILLALLQKSKTGKGSFIEVSLLDAAIASLANQATNWLIAGIVPQKQGSAHPNIAPYGEIFKTSAGDEILLAVGSNKQFKLLCERLSIANLATDPLFETNALRVKNRARLNAILSERIVQYSTQVLTKAFYDANIPYGVINTIKDVFASPEAQRLLMHSSDRVGVKSFVGQSGLQMPSHFLPPPSLGEHSREILLQSLEMPAHELEALIDAGVIA